MDTNAHTEVYPPVFPEDHPLMMTDGTGWPFYRAVLFASKADLVSAYWTVTERDWSQRSRLVLMWEWIRLMRAEGC